MDTSEFDSQIDEITNQQANLVEKMDNLKTPIIESYVVLLNKVFPEMMKKQISSSPEIAKQLGIEKLGEIKKEFNQFLAELPALCADTLNQNNYWRHKLKVKKGFEYEVIEEAQKGLLDKVRGDLTAHLGNFLHRHNLISPSNKIGDEWKIDHDRIYYGYGFSWNSDEEKTIQSIIKEYKDMYENHMSLQKEKVELERKKEEFIAASMWDDA